MRLSLQSRERTACNGEREHSYRSYFVSLESEHWMAGVGVLNEFTAKLVPGIGKFFEFYVTRKMVHLRVLCFCISYIYWDFDDDRRSNKTTG